MQTILFIIFLSLIIIQRVFELKLSKKNEKILIQKGANEYGKPHFKFMILLHTLFFISMVIEYSTKSSTIEFNTVNVIFFSFFIILQVFRYTTIKTLGIFWTVKIYRIPGEPLIKAGLYKYFKHPNYIIVFFEIIIIPLVFNLYLTSIVFTILNSLTLSVRIKAENKALNT